MKKMNYSDSLSRQGGNCENVRLSRKMKANIFYVGVNAEIRHRLCLTHKLWKI
jgi:hypothetical protein